jgi:hypothetical protein
MAAELYETEPLEVCASPRFQWLIGSVLDIESGMYGLRRSQFIELLFLNRIGHQALVRLKVAPTYHFTREELSETERFVIYLRPEVRRLFDEHLLQLGMRITLWVVAALNGGVGITEGKLA